MKPTVLAFATFFLSFPFALEAKTIEFEFQILKTNSSTANSLQEQLIQGGPMAQIAFEKHKAEKVDSLSFTVDSGARLKKSPPKQLILDNEGDLKYPNGLEVEVDPIISAAGIVDLNIHLRYAIKKKNDIHLFSLITMLNIEPLTPTLIGRWQEDDSAFFAVVIATHDQPVSLKDQKRQNIYTDVTYYKNKKLDESPIARIVIPGRSGNRSVAQSVLPTIVKANGVKEYQFRGLEIELDLVAKDDKISGNLNLDYGSIPRGNGAPANSVTYHSKRFQADFENAITNNYPLDQLDHSKAKQKQSDWLATVACAIAKPGNHKDTTRLVVEKYIEQPFQKQLSEARELYLKALVREYQSATKAGNAKLANLLKSEGNSIRDTGELTEADGDINLTRLQSVYKDLIKKADQSKREKMETLKKRYPLIEMQNN